MLPDETVPAGLAEVLKACRSCFSARSFPIFCLLAVGMIAQVGPCTVTGMLVGAGAQRLVGHDRVHRFFAEHRWSADQFGLCLARLIVARLLPEEAPIVLAVDDTLFRRRGKKVAEAYYGHDASQGGHVFVRGNRWVVLGIVVALPFCTRPVCLPVLLRLWRGKGTDSCVQLARILIGLMLRAFPDRVVHTVGDSAYRGGALSTLPERATLTTRIGKAAALYAPAPPPSGRRGRPRTKGERLGHPGAAATLAPERQGTVTRYGRTDTVWIKELTCLWYGAFGRRAGRLIVVRDRTDARAAALHLFTTDLTATAEEIVTRYAARWSVEVAIANAKGLMGVGQARNRVAAAVERTVPFGMLVMTIVQLWYALFGYDSADASAHRTARPWYTGKTEPAFSDMLVKLRRHIIKARFSAVHTVRQQPQQIDHDALAWSLTAA